MALEDDFQALKAGANLETMTLDELADLNVTLSAMRLEAAGATRDAVCEYALKVNQYITCRALDREAAIDAACVADPARAALRQGLGLRGGGGGG